MFILFSSSTVATTINIPINCYLLIEDKYHRSAYYDRTPPSDAVYMKVW